MFLYTYNVMNVLCWIWMEYSKLVHFHVVRIHTLISSITYIYMRISNAFVEKKKGHLHVEGVVAGVTFYFNKYIASDAFM